MVITIALDLYLGGTTTVHPHFSYWLSSFLVCPILCLAGSCRHLVGELNVTAALIPSLILIFVRPSNVKTRTRDQLFQAMIFTIITSRLQLLQARLSAQCMISGGVEPAQPLSASKIHVTAVEK